MNLDLYSYRLAENKLANEIAKLQKQMQKISSELYEMTDRNSTVRARANKRVRLSQISEDIYRHKEYLEQIREKIRGETRVADGKAI